MNLSNKGTGSNTNISTLSKTKNNFAFSYTFSYKRCFIKRKKFAIQAVDLGESIPGFDESTANIEPLMNLL